MRYPCALICFLTVSGVALAEPPTVKSFTMQKSGGTTYFRVQFAMPQGLVASPTPRLVPQDDHARTVVASGAGLTFEGQGAADATRAASELADAVGQGDRITTQRDFALL